MTAHDQIIRLAHRLDEDCPGQASLIEGLLLSLLADGSLLLESRSAPAAGNVLRSLAQSIHADSCRIPFGRDAGQADSACFEVYRATSSVGEFLFQPALIFSNLILLEGINHAPLQLQNALLSAIAEREVVVAGNSLSLPALFMVVATENAFVEGDRRTLSPEQRDRFLLQIALPREPENNPPTSTSAAKILGKIHEFVPQGALFEARDEVRRVRMPPAINDYILALTGMLRCPPASSAEVAQWLHRGVNTTRGAHALDRVARAYAWLHQRDDVTMDDVAAVGPDCLRHRLILNAKARAEHKSADDIVALLLEQPRFGDTRITSLYEAQT